MRACVDVQSDEDLVVEGSFAIDSATDVEQAGAKLRQRLVTMRVRSAPTQHRQSSRHRGACVSGQHGQGATESPTVCSLVCKYFGWMMLSLQPRCDAAHMLSVVRSCCVILDLTAVAEAMMDNC